MTIRLLLLTLVAGCASSATPPQTAPSPLPPPSSTAPAGPASTLPDEIRWVRNSAEYRALTRQVYRMATAQVKLAAKGKQRGAWGVILDADETVLDNSESERRLAVAKAKYTDSSWVVWVREKAAPAIPGAVDFIQRVKALGGRVAIVTNRADSLCAVTRDNLVAVGVQADLVLCLKPDSSNKNPRFRQVQRQFEVLAWVGDNIQDFPDLTQAPRNDPAMYAPFGVKYFVLPNPMYGSWERNPDW